MPEAAEGENGGCLRSDWFVSTCHFAPWRLALPGCFRALAQTLPFPPWPRCCYKQSPKGVRSASIMQNANWSSENFCLVS